MSLPHPSQGNRKTLEQMPTCRYEWARAKVAELADAQDSGSCGLNTRGGSSPPFRTRQVVECAEDPQASVLRSAVASRPAVALVVLSSPARGGEARGGACRAALPG